MTLAPSAPWTWLLRGDAAQKFILRTREAPASLVRAANRALTRDAHRALGRKARAWIMGEKQRSLVRYWEEENSR